MVRISGSATPSNAHQSLGGSSNHPAQHLGAARHAGNATNHPSKPADQHLGHARRQEDSFTPAHHRPANGVDLHGGSRAG